MACIIGAVQIAIGSPRRWCWRRRNAASTSDDLARRSCPGRAAGAVDLGTDQLAGLLVPLPSLLAADGVTLPSGRAALRVAMLLALATIFISVHVTAMIGLRDLVYRSAGSALRLRARGASASSTRRKDASTFVATLALLLALALAPSPSARRGTSSRRPTRISPSSPRAAAGASYCARRTSTGSRRRATTSLCTPAARPTSSASPEGDGRKVAQRGVRAHPPLGAGQHAPRAGHPRSDAGGLKVELANEEFAPLSERHSAAVVKVLASG